MFSIRRSAALSAGRSMADRLQAAGAPASSLHRQSGPGRFAQCRQWHRVTGGGAARRPLERRHTRRRLEAGAWARLLTGLPRMTHARRRLQELDQGDATSLGRIFRVWLLDERAWLQSQAFFLLRQGATEVALQRFQYLALPIIELLAHG